MNAGHQVFNKNTRINANDKFYVMIVPTHQCILHHEILNINRHFIRAKYHQILHLRQKSISPLTPHTMPIHSRN
ncbi:uncharacterized protein DS421_15g500100 [Arachis hypogaea]|nr:uncharacterized protein DS421_15g500100 [Arachis hypogaea]